MLNTNTTADYSSSTASRTCQCTVASNVLVAKLCITQRQEDSKACEVASVHAQGLAGGRILDVVRRQQRQRPAIHSYVLQPTTAEMSSISKGVCLPASLAAHCAAVQPKAKHTSKTSTQSWTLS